MANADPIVIAAAARTPIGGFQGEFKDLAAPSLGAAAAKAALVRSGVAPEDFEEVILGCVLPAGPGSGSRPSGRACRGPAAGCSLHDCQ
jgi:acetyl-CoA C-acetyltransferase